MADNSFDVVSKVEIPEVVNAIQQAQKEILTRYDLKDSKSTIELNEKDLKILLASGDDFKIKAVIDILQSKLVKRGVPMPAANAVTTNEKMEARLAHWSFQPVKRPAVPEQDSSSAKNAIDDFVLAKLKEKSLKPSTQADKTTLIRRLYFVAHGLVPSPEEVKAFVKDQRPEAYAKLVEKVLASPRYGERWARHWMDVVRYADTNGFETNRERKTAYYYRDYLISAFNTDKPYDQFVREQLAGDALGTDAATGFLVAGTYDIVKGDPMLNAMQRQDELADMVSTTSTAFLGLTMGCARCHNHKFDPILQKDYYAMQAIFAGVNQGERPIRLTLDADELKEKARLESLVEKKKAELEDYKQKADNLAQFLEANAAQPPVNSKQNEDVFQPINALALRFSISSSAGGAPCIDELEVYDESGENVALA